MERETGQTLEIYDNDISMHLAAFCKNMGIENEYDIFPSQWNAALKYIYNNIFKHNPSILITPHTVSNSYNLDAVNELLDTYIFMCYSHNQEISIQGFSFLSGISRETIHSWGSSSTRAYIYKDLQGNILNYTAISNLKEGEYIKVPSNAASDIYKKLVENNEESIVCLMKDRRNNPMKYLPILNRRHGWSVPFIRQENRAIETETPEQIAARYGQKSISGTVELPDVPE